MTSLHSLNPKDWRVCIFLLTPFYNPNNTYPFLSKADLAQVAVNCLNVSVSMDHLDSTSILCNQQYCSKGKMRRKKHLDNTIKTETGPGIKSLLFGHYANEFTFLYVTTPASSTLRWPILRSRSRNDTEWLIADPGTWGEKIYWILNNHNLLQF